MESPSASWRIRLVWKFPVGISSFELGQPAQVFPNDVKLKIYNGPFVNSMEIGMLEGIRYYCYLKRVFLGIDYCEAHPINCH